jgi:hypothetical protein
MEQLIATIELALIIVLPLILFYRQMKLAPGKIFLKVVLLYLTWFFTYALLHELCHVCGSWITGAEIVEHRLVPHYWEGDYKNAYVKSIFTNDTQGFISPFSPYFRDLIFLGTGYFLLRRRKLTGSFADGLIIVLFVLSPIYDVFNNYFGFVLGARNDFNAMNKVAGMVWTNAIGLLFTLTGIYIVGWLFVKLKKLADI